MGNERRRTPRASAPLDGEWDGASGHGGIRIADISAGGCFVETMAAPGVGEPLVVRVKLPGNHTLEARGVVTYVAQGIGFGVRFQDLSAEQQVLLDAAIERLLDKK